MKNFGWKVFFIIMLIGAYAIIGDLVLSASIGQAFIKYIDPIIWWGIGLATYFLLNGKRTIKDKSEKTMYIVTITIILTTVYYLLGVLFKFGNSVYSKSFIGILGNMFTFVSPVIPLMLLMAALVNHSNGKTKLANVLIVSLFVIINIDIDSVISQFNMGLSFSYLLGELVPLVVKQVFLVYLVKNCGVKCAVIYLIVPLIIGYLSPIIPSLDWFYDMLFEITGTLITFVLLYYSFTDEVVVKERRVKTTKSPAGLIASMLFIITAFAFVIGLLPIVPTVIVSNSMNPNFYRGDIVVYAKTNEVEVGSIIQYKHENIKVVHRIHEVCKDSNGETYYITKGDNNNDVDKWEVHPKDIEGVVQFVIPKVGYLSIWISQLFGGE